MTPYPPTVAIRHAKERLKKCSLFGLENRDDLQIYTFRDDTVLEPLPDLEGYVYLDLGAPPLSSEEAACGLLMLDGTWRLTRHMARCLAGIIEGMRPRSIPAAFTTAYPRYQTLCPDPERGLASVEALFAAHAILGRPTHGLLDHYHWRDEFLERNRGAIETTVLR